MARAKRTDRAEARRRYRSSIADDAASPDDGEPVVETAATGARRTPPPPPTAGPRRSIPQAFREAYHPLDVRGDLAALPWLLRSRAGWLPPLLVLAATAVVIGLGTASTIGNIAFYWFISPFPMAPAFLIGFLAPRASWLLAIPVGVLGAAATVLIIAFTPGAASSADAQAYIGYAFVISPPFTVLFAAAAAWYKRFLALINPNRRGRVEAARAGQKSGSRRSAVARR